MIIFRYLAKEVLTTTVTVTTILVVIFLGNQFARFLTQIAAGKLATSIILHLLLLETPFLIGYLAPIGLFIGIMLAYGRLYADNEMTVLRACGFSQTKLVSYTLLFSSVIVLLVAYLVLVTGPQVMRAQQKTIVNQGQALLMQSIVPGRFQLLPNEHAIFYAENVAADRAHVNNVFVAQRQKSNDKTDTTPHWVVTMAKQAYHKTNARTQQQLIIADNGLRYQGTPGNNAYDIMQFAKLGMVLPATKENHNFKVKTVSSQRLWHEKNHKRNFAAEWQWRLSMPFSVILLVLLAVPLARVSPRQGKFAKIVPATLIYMVYANLLFVSRGWIESGMLSTQLGMWLAHIPMLLLGVGLLVDTRYYQRLLAKIKRA